MTSFGEQFLKTQDTTTTVKDAPTPPSFGQQFLNNRDAATQVVSTTPEKAPNKFVAGAQAVVGAAGKAMQPLRAPQDWLNAIEFTRQALTATDPAERARLMGEARGRWQAAQAHLTFGYASTKDDEVKAQADRMVGKEILKRWGVDSDTAGLVYDIVVDPANLAMGAGAAAKFLKGTAKVTELAAKAAGAEKVAATAGKVADTAENTAKGLFKASDAIALSPVTAPVKVVEAGGNAVVKGLVKRGVITAEPISGAGRGARAAGEAADAGRAAGEAGDLAEAGRAARDAAPAVGLPGANHPIGVKAPTMAQALVDAVKDGEKSPLKTAFMQGIQNTLDSPLTGKVGETVKQLAGAQGTKYGTANLPSQALTLPALYGKDSPQLAHYYNVLSATGVGRAARSEITAGANEVQDALKTLQKDGTVAARQGKLPLTVDDLPGVTPKTTPGKISEAVTSPVTKLLTSTDTTEAARAVQEIRDLAAQTGIKESRFLDAAKAANKLDYKIGSGMERLGLAANITSKEGHDIYQAAKTLDDLIPAHDPAVLPKTRVGEMGVPAYVRAADGSETAVYIQEVNPIESEAAKAGTEGSDAAKTEAAGTPASEATPSGSPATGELSAAPKKAEKPTEPTLRIRDAQGHIWSVPDSSVRLDDLALGTAHGSDAREFARQFTANGTDGVILPGERERGYVSTMYLRETNHGERAAALRNAGRPDISTITNEQQVADTLAQAMAGIRQSAAPDAPVMPRLNSDVPATVLPDSGLAHADPSVPAPLNAQTDVPVNTGIPSGTPAEVIPRANTSPAQQLGKVLNQNARYEERAARGDIFTPSVQEKADRVARRVDHMTGGLNDSTKTSPLLTGDAGNVVRADPVAWQNGLSNEEAITRLATEFGGDEPAYDRAVTTLSDWLDSGRASINDDGSTIYVNEAPPPVNSIASAQSAADRQAKRLANAVGAAGTKGWKNTVTGRWAARVKKMTGMLPTKDEMAQYNKLLAAHQERMRVRYLDPKAVVGDLNHFFKENPHSTVFDGVAYVSAQAGGLPKDVQEILAHAVYKSEGYVFRAGGARLADALEYLGDAARDAEAFRSGGSNKALMRNATENQFAWFQKDVVRQALRREYDLTTTLVNQVQSRVGRLSYAANLQYFVRGLKDANEILDGRVLDTTILKYGKVTNSGGRLEDIRHLADGTGQYKGVTFTPDELAVLDYFQGAPTTYRTTASAAQAAFNSGWVKVDARTASLTNGMLKEGDYVTNHAFAHLMTATHVPDAVMQAHTLWAPLARFERVVTSAWLSSPGSAMNEFIGNFVIPTLSGRLSVGQVAQGIFDAVQHRRAVKSGDVGAKVIEDVFMREGVMGNVQHLLGRVAEDSLKDLAVEIGAKKRDLPAITEAVLRFLETRAGLRGMDKGFRHGLTGENIAASLTRASAPTIVGTRASLYNFRSMTTDIVREGITHAYIRKGMTPVAAAREASGLLGDMRALPLWAQAAARFPLAGPFLSWTQHASVLSLVTLFSHPQNALMLSRAPGAMDAAGGDGSGYASRERLSMMPNQRSFIRVGGNGWEGSGQYLNVESFNYMGTIPNMMTGFSADTIGPFDVGATMSIVRAVWSGQVRGGVNPYADILGFGQTGGFVEAYRINKDAATVAAAKAMATIVSPNLAPGGRQAQAYVRTLMALADLPDDGTPMSTIAHGLVAHPGGQLLLSYLASGSVGLAQYVKTGNPRAGMPRLSTSITSTPPQAAGTALARLLFPLTEVQGDPNKQGAAARTAKQLQSTLQTFDQSTQRMVDRMTPAQIQAKEDERFKLANSLQAQFDALDR